MKMLLALVLFSAACSDRPAPESSVAVPIDGTAGPFRIAGISDLIYGGYEQWYMSVRGDRILEARYCSKSPVTTQAKIDQYIRDATSVTEEKPGRYLLQVQHPRGGPFAILTSDGSKCFQMISTETLELARDFEQNRYKPIPPTN